jgi:putative transferase (TIGR04331 family)
MKKRFLITTAEENSWKTDRPVLFLGEWCRLYKQRKQWKNFDAVVLPYHWDDREKYFDDYSYLQKAYEETLWSSCEALNSFHGTNYSVRYWRIIIGPWLFKFVNTLYDRWVMVHIATNNYSIDSTIIFKQDLSNLVPLNMKDYIDMMWDDKWNNYIIGEVIKNYTDIKWEEKKCTKINNEDNIIIYNKKKISYKKRLLKMISGLLGKFTSNTEIFIINSYLPLLQEIIFQVYLKQFPKIWTSLDIKKFALDDSKRSLFNVKTDSADKFIKFSSDMVSSLIPTVYLEGYKDTIEQTESLPWPSKPKVIFTSNAYEHDDLFKIWAAKKVEFGVPLVLGQHGGFFGVSKWNAGEEHQVNIADRFITWGWDELRESIYPGIAFPYANKRQDKWKKDGDLLLVTVPISRYSWKSCSWPVAANQSNKFVNDQLDFAESLPGGIRNRLIVRLLANFDEQQKTSYKERWQDGFPEVEIDPSILPISSVVRRCRLFISGYNATTYLYSFSMNIPTIMFWDPSYMELRPNAQAYFDRLKHVGILHHTSESAASKIAEIWDDVEGWWYQDEIQKVRREFCEQFAFTTDRPFYVLKEALAIQ